MQYIQNKTKRYEKIKYVGEGQFATVYKARDVETDIIVAVKKIKTGTGEEAQNGINKIALREIKLLQELHHKNVINLRDVFGHLSNVSLVFEFMDTDLEIIIKDTTIILTTAHIKSYILQILQGLDYLHTNWILHRDLKPNNLLVNCSGVLKIGDFGLAKLYDPSNPTNTPHVVTRWYRAPELLFGATQYSTGIDMWAVGCILPELILRIPLFPGKSDLDQLSKIFGVLGNPTEENWPGVKSLVDYIEFKPFQSVPLENIFTEAGDDLLDLLESLLVLDPVKRKECSECLELPFFSNKPAPTLGPKLPLPKNIRKTNGKEKPYLKRKLRAEGAMLPQRLVF